VIWRVLKFLLLIVAVLFLLVLMILNGEED
jgi:hypothetical protein